MTDHPIHGHPAGSAAANQGAGDGLLRPEPTTERVNSARGGMALFGLCFAGIAVAAIYASAPVDLPEYPDCPVQAIGSCGHH